MSEHMPITFLVRMSREFVETAMSRTVGGDKITFELSEPDAEGVREVKFTVHYDDNIIASSSARVKELETEKERYRKALLWCERNLSCAGSLGMPRSVARSVGAAIRVSERVLRGEESR